MKITVNLDTQAVITQPLPLRIKAGAFTPIAVAFTRASQTMALPQGAVVEFALKPRNQWTGGLLAYLNVFELTDGNLYTGTLNCASASLLGALGLNDTTPLNDLPQLEASAEVTWSFGGQKFRSVTFAGIVEPPVTDDSAVASPDPELYPAPAAIAHKSDLPQRATASTPGVMALATQAEVEAGSDDTKAVTPSTLKDALDGKEPFLGSPAISGYVLSSTPGNVRSWIPLPPGGINSIPSANIAYVETTGNDASAIIGDRAKPFATAQAAYQAIYTAYQANTSASFALRFGAGSFSIDIGSSGDWPASIYVAGCGHSISTLTVTSSFVSSGASGSGSNGHNMTITDIGYLSLNLIATGGKTNANGKTGGTVTLTDSYCTSTGGAGGYTGNCAGCNGGAKGGNVVLNNCIGNATGGTTDSNSGSDAGYGGGGGNVTMTNCRGNGTGGNGYSGGGSVTMTNCTGNGTGGACPSSSSTGAVTMAGCVGTANAGSGSTSTGDISMTNCFGNCNQSGTGKTICNKVFGNVTTGQGTASCSFVVGSINFTAASTTLNYCFGSANGPSSNAFSCSMKGCVFDGACTVGNGAAWSLTATGCVGDFNFGPTGTVTLIGHSGAIMIFGGTLTTKGCRLSSLTLNNSPTWNDVAINGTNCTGTTRFSGTFPSSSEIG